MNASDSAAWWGAIVATIVFIWELYKWLTSGAQVRVSASGNMQTLNRAAGRIEDDKLAVVEAANNGDKPTTLTSLVVKHYKSQLHRLVGRPARQFFVANPDGDHPLPFVLEPGHSWTGLVDQKVIEEKVGTGGVLYCGVRHTASRWLATAKVPSK